MRCAASPELRESGVVVVLNGSIDAADAVTKTHATALDTFRSLDTGPLGSVGEGGVAEAVVWLDDITSGKAFNFPEPALNQKNCDFAPHVLLMQPGTLKVLSSDAASHNIHVFSSANREVNQVMPPQGSPVEVTLARPDQVKILCEIHKWMSAYIFVVKNPYYVLSGIGGAYALSDVPAGKYHVKVWQESLGTQTQEVTVETGKMVTINFNLGSK